jgi:hypothetical protein
MTTIQRPPGCTCHGEIGDSRCNVHPSCDYCGEEIVKVVGRCGSDGRYCSAAHMRRGEGVPDTSGAEGDGGGV